MAGGEAELRAKQIDMFSISARVAVSGRSPAHFKKRPSIQAVKGSLFDAFKSFAANKKIVS